MDKPRPSRRRWTLHHYHRYLGLASALLVVVLSVTGIMLNHTEGLRLDERKVTQQWLLDLYGIQKPQLQQAFTMEGQWLAQWDDEIYFDAEALNGIDGELVGGLIQDELLVVVSKTAIGLFASDGELIDILGAPAPLTAVGLTPAKKLIIRSLDAHYSTNEDLTELHEIKSPTDVQWVLATSPPDDYTDNFLSSFRGKGLPLERIVLDLHSGRILGNGGVLLMDLAALFLIALAFTGLYTWGRRKWRQR